MRCLRNRHGIKFALDNKECVGIGINEVQTKQHRVASGFVDIAIFMRVDTSIAHRHDAVVVMSEVWQGDRRSTDASPLLLTPRRTDLRTAKQPDTTGIHINSTLF